MDKILLPSDVPTEKWIHVRAIDHAVTLKARRVMPGSLVHPSGAVNTDCADRQNFQVAEEESIAILGSDGIRLVPVAMFSKLYRRP